MKTRTAQAIARTRRALASASSTHAQTIALELLYEQGIGVGLEAGLKAFSRIAGLKIKGGKK